MALSVTPTDEMKTLTVGEKIYEIVDDEARTDLTEVKADFLQSLIYDTASGSVATFADGAHNMPCKSVVAQIVPVQSGSGDPSPDNVRPISGWDAVTVEQRGKNLLEPKFYGGIRHNASVGAQVGTPTEYSDVVDDHDGSWTRACAAWGQCSMIAPVVPGVTYKLSGTISAPDVAVCVYIVDATNNVVEVINPTNFTISDLSILRTFTPSASAKYLFLYIATRSAGDITVTKPMLEVNSTATPYEPYTGSAYSVNLPQTVYGGQVDVVSGVLTIDRAYHAFNGTEDWNKSGSALNGYYTYHLRDAVSADEKAKPYGTAISDKFELVKNATAYFQSYGKFLVDNAFNFNVNPSEGVTDVASFKTWLSTTPVEVCYELATPITIQLTPQEVSTLYGPNTVYADSGDVAVEYPADTKLYINKVITDAVSALS